MTNIDEKKKFDLEERLINFSVNMIDIVENLPNSRTGSQIADQLIRCGTSPACNYAEAQSAESRKDFVHKVKITLKELRETKIWLNIIKHKGLIKDGQKMAHLLNECEQLIAIFASSIKTAQKNMKEK